MGEVNVKAKEKCRLPGKVRNAVFGRSTSRVLGILSVR